MCSGNLYVRRNVCPKKHQLLITSNNLAGICSVLDLTGSISGISGMFPNFDPKINGGKKPTQVGLKPMIKPLIVLPNLYMSQ